MLLTWTLDSTDQKERKEKQNAPFSVLWSWLLTAVYISVLPYKPTPLPTPTTPNK